MNCLLTSTRCSVVLRRGFTGFNIRLSLILRRATRCDGGRCVLLVWFRLIVSDRGALLVVFVCRTLMLCVLTRFDRWGG